MRRRNRLAWLLPLVMLGPGPGCDGLPLLAPTGSTIMLVARPAVVPVGGESVLTATVTEPAGTPVPNGTVVTFSTSLGTVDPQEASTTDGRATARLVAGSRSGVAMVTAFSGNVTSEPLAIQIGP